MRGIRGVRAVRSGAGGMYAAGICGSGCASACAGSNKDGFIGIGRIDTSSIAVGGRMAAATAACAADSTDGAACAVARVLPG